MTLFEMRAILRRQLNEETEQDWTDAMLDVMLNVGLQTVAKRFRKINPNAIVYIDTVPILSGDEYVPLPVGLVNTLHLQILNSTSLAYDTLKPRDYSTGRDLISSSEGDSSLEVRYSLLGRFVVLSPVPSAAGTLRVIYSPDPTVTEDTDVPPVPLFSHMAIVLYAKLFLLGETNEDTMQKTKDLIEEVLGDLTEHYLPHAAAPPAVVPTRIRNAY